MHVDLDDEDEDGVYPPEQITDPIIQRYAGRLHALTFELMQETEHYNLNREQIDQFISVLVTLRTMLVYANDLSTLDAMLRMTFSDDYYTQTDDILPMLTNFPLSTEN